MNASESNRRIAQRIALAKAKHMSDAKWRKLFAAMHAMGTRLRGVTIKFINDDRRFDEPIPGPEFEHDGNFGECGGISYQPFSHIEFVEIPDAVCVSVDEIDREFKNDLHGFERGLQELGDFPIQRHSNGVRIVGYEW